MRSSLKYLQRAWPISLMHALMHQDAAVHEWIGITHHQECWRQALQPWQKLTRCAGQGRFTVLITAEGNLEGENNKLVESRHVFAGRTAFPTLRIQDAANT